MRVAAAPVSWGVFDSDSDVPPEAVLDDIAATGYGGSELGPLGYYGTAEDVRRRFESRGLALVGSFLPLPFSDRDAVADNLQATADLLDYLERASPDGDLPTVLLSDAYQEPNRIAAAGRVQAHPEVWLSESRWGILLDQVNSLAQFCDGRGFQVAFHPHGGSYIETPEEVARLFAGTTEVLGLCLDTGHCFFGGGSPLSLLHDLGHLLRWVHLKDVHLAVLARLKNEGFGIDEAWRQGIFCELGRGGVDIPSFLRELRAQGYQGWLVVEQDRIVKSGETPGDARRSADHNRSFLRRLGV
jgi:inosose dehydratase